MFQSDVREHNSDRVGERQNQIFRLFSVSKGHRLKSRSDVWHFRQLLDCLLHVKLANNSSARVQLDGGGQQISVHDQSIHVNTLLHTLGHVELLLADQLAKALVNCLW